MFDLEEEVMTAKKCTHGTIPASTSVNVRAIPFMFQNRIWPASLESMNHDYDKYCVVHSGSYEGSREERADDMSFMERLEQKMLWVRLQTWRM